MVSVKIQLKISGYNNDHDGYCSGNECTYQEFSMCKTKLYEFDPQDFSEFIKDCLDFTYIDLDTANKWFSNWLNYLTNLFRSS